MPADVRIIEGLDEPLYIPLILLRAQVAMQEPLGAFAVEGHEPGSPPHTNVVDAPILPIKVDYGEGAPGILLDSRRERVGFAITAS